MHPSSSFFHGLKEISYQSDTCVSSPSWERRFFIPLSCLLKYSSSPFPPSTHKLHKLLPLLTDLSAPLSPHPFHSSIYLVFPENNRDGKGCEWLSFSACFPPLLLKMNLKTLSQLVGTDQVPGRCGEQCSESRDFTRGLGQRGPPALDHATWAWGPANMSFLHCAVLWIQDQRLLKRESVGGCGGGH